MIDGNSHHFKTEFFTEVNQDNEAGDRQQNQMIAENKTAFPLCWPPGRPVAQGRRTNRNFKSSFATARDLCMAEIKRLGGADTIISTNIPLKKDGTPQAVDWGKTIPQPGVAVYFKRNGKQLCFACDCWNHVQDNMQAIARTIEALRGIARWGTGDMMEAAFTGFMALPERSSGENPLAVLGLDPARQYGETEITAAFRRLALTEHPDKPTGSAEKFRRIKEAHDMAQQTAKKSSFI